MNKKWIHSLLASALTISSLTVPAYAGDEAIDHLGRNGTYSASDVEGDTTADKAFDGIVNHSSRWGTNQYNDPKTKQHVQVEFSEPKSVKEFKLTFEDREQSTPEVETNVKAYHVEVKKEGSETFETIFTKESGVKGVEEFSIGEAVTVKVVKLVIDEIDSAGWKNVSVQEFEIYGDRNIESTANKNHMLGAEVTVSTEETAGLNKSFLNDGEQSTGTSADELAAYRSKRWASAATENTAAWVKAVFEKPTQVSEVHVNFWRDVDPLDSQVKAFTIAYTDGEGQAQEVKVTNTKLTDKTGYEDFVVYQFESPVVMKDMTIKNFEVESCNFNNISIEEIEVFSNKQDASADVETRPDINHMKQATMTASSREIDEFTPSKMNNGNKENTDRWASREKTWEGEWVNAAFAKPTQVKQLDFYLFTRNVDPTPSNIKSFDIVLTLQDGNTKTVSVANTQQGNGYKKFVSVVLDEAVVATSMKVQNFDVEGKNDNQYPNVSIVEIELYSNEHDSSIPTDLEGVVASITGETIEAGTDKLSLPTVPQGFEVTFNGCDFEQIVDGKLAIHTPLVDKEVKINFNVKDTKTGKTKNTGDVVYVIKGSHTVDESKNTKPVVVPEIQEWYSESTEKVALDTLTKVIYNDASLKAIVEEFVKDYKDFTGKTLEAKQGDSAEAGAFYFEKTDSLAYLGDEGYEMDIQADRIIVKSCAVTGNMYGMQTVHQMYKEDATGYKVGTMHDYPRFAVRGLLLDVARKPISLEMMKEITRTMRYYKMNDFQAHLSDNYIFLEQYGKYGQENESFKAYEAFRLESSLTNSEGESPTAKDYSISKADFKQFILDERALGMKVVPEIDMPAHATSFTKVWPELAVHNQVSSLNANRPLVDHFDLTKQAAKDKIKEIFDDYTRGPNPTFDSETTVHIGADEFLYNYTSYRTWLNEIVPHVKETNPVRLWGGLTWINDNKTEISQEAIEGVEMNLWSADWASGVDMYNMGYKLINTIDDFGYMVPNGNFNRPNAYGDLLNVNRVFSDFEANRVRNRGGAYAYIPSGDDQALGAVFAIWSDNIDKQSNGLTESDLYWRFFDALPFYAEKTWAATGKEKGTANNLIEVTQTKGTGPNTNPYYQASKTGEAYEQFDFASLKDVSENGRDLTNLTNATVENGVLDLADGESYVNTPIEQLGNGHSLSFEITIDQPYEPGDIIFEEDAPYGTHDIRIMDDGRLGFTRELHDYYFDYKLPVGKTVTIEITTEQQKTKLYVDGEFNSQATGRFFHENMVKKAGITNSTFALPLERIGSKTNAIDANIDNVKVVNLAEKPVVGFDEGKENWTATTDSETTEDNIGPITSAFDNDSTTQWHSDWQNATDKVPSINGNPGLGQGADGSIWAEITFGEPKTINQISFTPRLNQNSGYVTKASLFIKPAERSDEWVEVAHEQVFANNASKKSFDFPRQSISAFKFVAHQSSDGWVCISEFNIADVNRELELYAEAEKGQGTVTVDKTDVVYGDTVTVTATPREGYAFEGWYDAILGTELSKEATYTFTMSYNTAIVARFVPTGEVEEINYKGLEDALKAATEIDRSKFTEASLAVLDAAVAAGTTLPEEHDQAMVNELTKAILDAIVALEPLPEVDPDEVEKTDLETLVSKAEDFKAEGYTTESYEALQAAILAANEVLADENATQEDVLAAYEALQAAIDGLTALEPEQGEPADKAKLEALVSKAEGIKADGYTKESYDILQEAIKTAKALLENKDATQEQIDAIYGVLEAAINGLEKLPTTPGETDKPATGDATNILGLFAMASLAAAGIYVSVRRKKEEHI